MTYVKINDTLYPATVDGKMVDREWDDRASKAITVEMNHAAASKLFVDGLVWSIVERHEVPVYQIGEQGKPGTETEEIEWDNSEYSIAGALTDHRDGTITVKMGKLTELEEAYKIMLGGV